MSSRISLTMTFVQIPGSNTDDALKDCKGWLFILPAVSIGNVGQIAIDLLISTAKLKKVGYWYSPYTVSTACNDPLATKQSRVKGRISLSVEVFYCSKRKIVMLQRRAPILKGGAKMFVRNILEWVKAKEFSNVILASSSGAHLTEDSQTKKFWATCTNVEEKILRALQEMKIPIKSPKSQSQGPSKDTQASSNSREFPSPKELLRYGTGTTRDLIQSCHDLSIPMLALLAQVNEGDNTIDGQHMALILSNVIQLIGEKKDPLLTKPIKFRMPFAYKHVYGPEPDRNIYT